MLSANQFSWNFWSWVSLKRLNFIPMGLSYIAISAVCTVLSFVGLHWWTELSLVRLKSDGLISENYTSAGNISHVVDLLLGSSTAIALLANFVLNVFILLILVLKVSLLLHPGTCNICRLTWTLPETISSNWTLFFQVYYKKHVECYFYLP